MQLKQWVDTLVAASAPAADRHPYPEGHTHEQTYRVVTVVFETSLRHASQRERNGRASGRTPVFTGDNSHRVSKSTSATSAPTVLSSNPIAQFLRDVPSAPARKQRERPSAPRTSRGRTRVPSVTQSAWTLHALAPLIQWLHTKGVRYTYADWECQATNGERVRTVSQHGVVVEDRHVARNAEYMCTDAFGPRLFLRTTRTTYVNAPPPSPLHAWWTNDQAGAMTNDGEVRSETMPEAVVPDERRGLNWADNGVYHQARQHRVYQWDSTTTLHLTTTDAKTYRVWVEHRVDGVGCTETFRGVVAQLAYHLSFYA